MKTILIRGPKTDEEVISSFPLIHFLKDEYSDAKISVILDEGQKNLYNFLPFSVEVYFLPQNKTSLMGIHHYAVNLLDVFNVDYYIDLENTLKSSFMGFSFKAKKRLGYKYGVNSFFLTYKLDGKRIPPSYDPDEKYLNIFSSYKNKEAGDYKAKPKIERNVKEKPERNVLVILSNASDYKSEMLKILSEFEEKNFWVALINKDPAFKETDFIQTLQKSDTSNTYKIVEFETYQELQERIFDSAFVITDVDWICHSAAYLGRDSFLLARDKRSMPKYRHFESSPVRITFSAEEITMNMERENQKISDIKSLVDFMHKFLGI